MFLRKSPLLLQHHLILSPKLPQFKTINSNIASNRSSQIEEIKPMLNVLESYSVISFNEKYGLFNHTGTYPPSCRDYYHLPASGPAPLSRRRASSSPRREAARRGRAPTRPKPSRTILSYPPQTSLSFVSNPLRPP